MRRSFLAATAAAATAHAASDTVRIGIVGLGGRGTHLMTKEVTRVPGRSSVTHLCEDGSGAARKGAGGRGQSWIWQGPRQ